MREWIGPRRAASACGGEFASTLPPASQKPSGPLCHGAQSVSDMNAVLLAGTRQTREGAGRTSGVGPPDITSILRRGPDLCDARAPWSRRHSAHNEPPWEPPQRGHPNPGTAHRQRCSPLPRPPLPPRPCPIARRSPLSARASPPGDLPACRAPVNYSHEAHRGPPAESDVHSTRFQGHRHSRRRQDGQVKNVTDDGRERPRVHRYSRGRRRPVKMKMIEDDGPSTRSQHQTLLDLTSSFPPCRFPKASRGANWVMATSSG